MLRLRVVSLCAVLSFASTASAQTLDYSYDSAGRLLEARSDAYTITYVYDAAGNLLSRRVTVTDAGVMPDGGVVPDGGVMPDGGTTDGGTGADGGPGGGDDGGCGCQVPSRTGGSSAPFLAGLVALLLVLRRRRRWLLGPFVALAVLWPSADAQASTVCASGCDHTSIGAALGAMSIGETITIGSGIYFESGLRMPRMGTLRSESGRPADVVIDGGGAARILSTAGDALIEGITFRDGDEPVGQGGALLAGGAITIRNCAFDSNTAATIGGAIAQLGGGPLTVLDSIFVRNTAQRGGAIFSSGHVTIARGIFRNNTAADPTSASGGALHLRAGALVTNTRFEANTTRAFRAAGGAINLTSAGVYEFQSSSLTGNSAISTGSYAEGGGIRIGSGCTAIFMGGSISGNQTMGSGSHGAGIYSSAVSPAPQLIGTTVSGNTSETDGGGIFCGTVASAPAPGGFVSGNMPDETFGCTACTGTMSRACTTALPAMCAMGTQTCTAAGLWGVCEPTVAPDARETMCTDMADNDCDGTIDAADTECVPPPNDTHADLPAAGCVEDPINTFTGELFMGFDSDIDLGGLVPLRFTRYYASRLMTNGVTSTLGDNWRHSYEYDLVDMGASVEVVDPRGRTLHFDEVGAEFVLAEPADIRYQLVRWGEGFVFGDPTTGRILSFDGSGALIEIADANGNGLSLTYTSGNLTRVTDGRGRSLTFRYSGGRIDRVSDGTRNVNFFYSGTDLTRVNDVRGNDTRYAYAASSRMTSWTPPSGVVRQTQTYDASGRVMLQTDAEGDSRSLAYGSTTGVTTVTDGAGATVRHTHSVSGVQEADEREDGTTANRTYDGDARPIGQTDRLGNATSTTYDDLSGQVVTHTRADGTTLSFTYERRITLGILFWDRVETRYPDGTTRTSTYDDAGNMLTWEDRRGEVWAWTYDARGRVTSIVNPEGGTTSQAWSTNDTLASRTDAASNTTTYGYDAQLRLTSITRADGSVNRLTYDAADHPLTLTDGRGNTASSTWDVNGNLATTTDRESNTTSFEYDGMDRLVATVDPSGQRRTITRDVRGRVASFITSRGVTWTNGYDPRGRLVTITDAMGGVWRSSWDAENGLMSTTNPLDDVAMYTTDALQRLTGVTSPEGRMVAHAYDMDGRPTSSTPGVGPVYTRTLDAEGRVVGVDVGGLTSAMIRDGLGGIVETTDPLGSDRPQRFDSAGHLLGRSDPLGNETQYVYDDRNRVSTITFPGGLGTLMIGYDQNDNPLTRTYSDGTSMSYTWDREDRLTAADGVTLAYDENGDMVESNGLTIGRDAFGRIDTITYAAGKDVTYTYDTRGLLSTITDWVGGETAFSYDTAGRLSIVARPNGVTTTYAYDGDGLVTSITHGSLASAVLTRDGGGRITQAARTPAVPITIAPLDLDLTYDAASQVVSRTYDAMGRLTSDGATTYTWDLASRLVSRDAVDYAYDAYGNLTSRTEGGATTDYVWSYALDLPSIAVERSAATDIAYNVYTPNGDLVYRVDAATDARIFHHFDEVGHTVVVSDEAGAATATYAYGPYGELLGMTGTVDNPFTWLGQHGVLRDATSAQYYIRARWYDSGAARFISRDQERHWSPGAINPYAYTNRDPLHHFDRTGRSADSLSTPEDWLQWANEWSESVQPLRDACDANRFFRGAGRPKGHRSRWERTPIFDELDVEDAQLRGSAFSNALRLILEEDAIVARGGGEGTELGGREFHVVSTPELICRTRGRLREVRPDGTCVEQCSVRSWRARRNVCTHSETEHDDGEPSSPPTTNPDDETDRVVSELAPIVIIA